MFLRLKNERLWGVAGCEIARLQISVPETSRIRLAYPKISDSETIIPDPLSFTEDIDNDPPIIPWQHKIHEGHLLAVRKNVGIRINLASGVMETLDFGLENILTMGFCSRDIW